MQIVLRLEKFQFLDEGNDWYIESGFLEVLIGFLQQTEYGRKVQYYYCFNNDKVQKVSSFTEVISIIQQNHFDYYVFSESSSKTSDWNLMLGITETGFEFVLTQFSSIEASVHKCVDSMIKMTINLYKIFKDAAYVGNRLAIEIYDIEGYEPDNGKLNESWEGFHIVDFISENHKVDADMRYKIIKLIKKVPLPAGASLLKMNGLIIIKWVNKFSDKKLIATGMKKRDQWIYENIGN